MKEEKQKNKFIQTPFSELEEIIQQKFISEFAFKIILVILSIIIFFFIEIKLAILILFTALIFLATSIYSLLLFMRNKAYYLDGIYLGIWQGKGTASKIKQKVWNKGIKGQTIICVEADGERYHITLNKPPTFIVKDTVRIYAVPEAIYKGTDGIYKVSGVLHIYKVNTENANENA